jgi:plasmid maintenance system antidote protein VapI
MITKMHNPPHQGLTLKDDVLPALGLSVTEAAKQLGVTRVALSRVLVKDVQRATILKAA